MSETPTNLHTHTHTHQCMHRCTKRRFFTGWWRKVNGCHRKEEDPAEETHMLLASSPPTAPRWMFVSPLTHVQTSWHTLCLRGEIMLSLSQRVLPAHQGSRSTHSAGSPTLSPHHSFIAFHQNPSTPGQEPGRPITSTQTAPLSDGFFFSPPSYSSSCVGLF